MRAACLHRLSFAAAAAVVAVPGVAAARTQLIGAVSAIDLRSPEDGKLEEFGRGAVASMMFLESNPEPFAGVEINTAFVIGENGRRLYDFGVSALFSTKVHGPVIPFLAVGLDIAAAAVPDPGELMPSGDDKGVGLGVHGGLGIHGFLDEDHLYWRVQVGWLGAGPGGLFGGVSVGWVFDDSI